MYRQKQHLNRRQLHPVDPYLVDAKKFVNLYYDTMDNRRGKLVHLYGTTCRLLFDGNPYVGGEAIGKFWQESFPPESLHTLRNQDYKNLDDHFLILVTSGEVVIADYVHTFSQVLTCQRHDGMWKIMSDNYRLLT